MRFAPLVSFGAWWITVAHYSDSIEPLVGVAMMCGMAASAWVMFQQTRWW
jgi:hypothetical protein